MGAVTALTHVGTVENPALFQGARAVGAWLGLTPRRYQSGEIDVSGCISRCGDPKKGCRPLYVATPNGSPWPA